MSRLFALFLSGAVMLLSSALPCWSQRDEVRLEKDWMFHLGDVTGADAPDYDDSSWEKVTVPHDWAIKGPFSRDIDLQLYHDGKTIMTGRTGGLPYVGVGWYRRTFAVPAGKRTALVFDGAMSEAHVYVNGKEVCFWPNGYNSFHCDITDVVTGGDNVLAVRLENLPESSRWYPGAGLYRNVHLVFTEEVHVPVWGTYVTTPKVTEDYASVCLETMLENAVGLDVVIRTDIIDADGKSVAESDKTFKVLENLPLVQNIIVPAPKLWSPENPSMYRAVSSIYVGDKKVDEYVTSFGIRTVEFVPEIGFMLNGKVRKFRGVCNHHDLGPLGAAVNEAALRHQIMLLKDMGCDAIRTSHNIPAPELVSLCDELGMMMMVEAFDEWDVAKCRNGYHRFFDEWAEKDLVNMIRHYRNNPSVVMWSIGNEVPSQREDQGYKVAAFLQDICHREDPTRLVTCGMEQTGHIMKNGFIDVMDVVGINYHPWDYLTVKQRTSQGLVLGSETGSTVSSRGVYKFPAVKRFSAFDPDHHSNAYEMDACDWANIPDVDFALEDDYPWAIGQFVWTGFDYLGEPTPYDCDSWPNHSSMFGIIDLASIPKDRFWLFRSKWNTESPTLHVLPHWTWPGHEGDKIPVHVFTSYPSAELFVNGVSYGLKSKLVPDEKTSGLREENTELRYRLIWDDVRYVPGELKVIAYDKAGNPCDVAYRRTAGKPHHIILETDRKILNADGKDLAYVIATVVDKAGIPCPFASDLMEFKVSGSGSFKATANGDPTCLLPFQEPRMKAFSGKLTVILQAGEQPGVLTLEVKSEGLKRADISIPVVEPVGKALLCKKCSR